MTINYPTSLDNFTNPSASDTLDSPTAPHATQHSDLNDAVEALQAKVGADSSAVTTSHDYKIADHASRLTTLEALGDYTDYSGSITFTNFTLGNGTVDYAQYARVGDLVHYWGQVTLGSTSSITGLLFISAPVPVYGSQRAPGTANYTEAGVGAYTGVARPTAGNGIVMYATYIIASFGRESNVQPAIPFTWGTGDSFHWNVVYRGS
jgi:hypothetical protein